MLLCPSRSYVIRQTGLEHRGTMRFNFAVSDYGAHELRTTRLPEPSQYKVGPRNEYSGGPPSDRYRCA